jgi:hypothetical protein
MSSAIKFKFKTYPRRHTYYAQNCKTGQKESLHTKDKAEATPL